MLSVFPEILFLSPLGAFLLRIALTAVFAYTGWEHLKKPSALFRVLAVAEIVAAGALLMGAWTQPATLLGIVLAAIWLLRPDTRTLAQSSVLLALVMCLSLLVTGPGAFAFDLPL